MSPLQLHAGCRSGEVYPSGLTLDDVFGREDRAGGLYLVGLYAGPGLFVELVDPGEVDPPNRGDITEDDLSEDEYARYEAMCAVKWSAANVAGIWLAEVGDVDLLVFGQPKADGTGMVFGWSVEDGADREAPAQVDQCRAMALAAAAFVDRNPVST